MTHDKEEGKILLLFLSISVYICPRMGGVLIPLKSFEVVLCLASLSHAKVTTWCSKCGEGVGVGDGIGLELFFLGGGHF